MDSNIQIIEKPDWVSWEHIKQCLVAAHSVNRIKGINMSHYQWDAEKIRGSIEPNGVMLVALDNGKVIGTAAFSEKIGEAWYVKGRYAYLCYAGVIPEYSGRGIFKKLQDMREEILRERTYSVVLFDTHEKNKRRIDIARLNGYRPVHFFKTKSKDHHCNVIMAKWPEGCPFSHKYCQFRFLISKIRSRLF